MAPEKNDLYEEEARAPDPIEVTEDNRVYEDLIAVYNRFGRIIQGESKRLGIPAKDLAALIRMVSSGRAFDVDGRLLISFSPGQFHRFWGKEHEKEFSRWFKFDADHPGARDQYSPRADGRFLPFHQVPDQEWRAYETAAQLDAEAAARSTAMGLGQIMGLNHEIAGFASAVEMFKVMQVSVSAQVEALVNFIENTDGLVESLKAREYRHFCEVYFNNAEAAGLAKRMHRLSDAYRTLTSRRQLKAF